MRYDFVVFVLFCCQQTMYNNADVDDSDVTTELPCLHRLLLVATAVCDILALITSAKEVTFSSLSVCLLATLRKTFKRICMKFLGKVGDGPINK